MPIIYREEKGAPLTITELDGNFRFVAEKLDEHEEQISHISGVASVTNEAEELIFRNIAGDELYRLSIPIPQFAFTGEWESGMAYIYGNIISKLGAKYVCLRPHTSADWRAESEHWLCIDSSASSGTPAHSAMAAAASASERGAAAREATTLLTKLPIFPVESLPEPQIGARIIVAIGADPGFLLGLGTPRGWVNATTHEPLA